MIRHSFTIANLVLIALLSYMGVSSAYRLLIGRPPPVPARPPAAVIQVPRERAVNRPWSDYRAIVDRDLFKTGTAPSAEQPKIDLEGLKQTELNLKLWGTVSGLKGAAYAVIEDTKLKQQNLYREGDSLQNAEVKVILREKVVLSVNGRDEILTMEEVKSTGPPSRFSGTTASADSPATRAQRITLRRAQIEEAMQNVSELMGQVKVRPHFENGQPEGLTLSSIAPRSIFRRMGLRNGDVIKGVDGQRIESVDDALKFYESIRSASNMTVDIQRRGRDKSIEYVIK